MTMFELLVFCYFLIQQTDPTKTDEITLQGKWELASVESKGDLTTGDEAKKERMSCEINGDQLVFIQGHQRFNHTFRVNTSQKPAALDTFFPDGKGVNYGIYRLEGTKLTICVSEKWNPNKPDLRPIRFTSKREDNKNLYGLVVYTFEKKPLK